MGINELEAMNVTKPQAWKLSKDINGLGIICRL